MKYYKVQVVLGHLGRGNDLETWIYVKAKNILKAITKARMIPAVKHSKLPLKAVEISEEEYADGIKNGDYFNKIEQIFNV